MAGSALDPQAWRSKLSETHARASQARKRETEGLYSEAFDHYIASASSYLYLIRHAPEREQASGVLRQLKDVAAKLLERAERIKAAKKVDGVSHRNRLIPEEQDLVLNRSASINSQVFPVWPGERACSTSTAHIIPYGETFSSWTTVSALISASNSAKFYGPDLKATDLVQDAVTDCSFVAGLVVLTDHGRKYGHCKAAEALYPKNSAGEPSASERGRYYVRLLLNGEYRQVVVDEKLPTSSSGRLACAQSRKLDIIWPAILEKAYLTARGGWDFAGSNSSVDLHALIGWIPETIQLDSATFQSDRVWDRILDGFASGRCLATAGTGEDDENRLEALGLTSVHAYAILNIEERVNGERLVTLYNAWNRGNAGGGRPRSPVVDLDSAPIDSVRRGLHWGAFTISYRQLKAAFNAIYLNWTPDIFKHQQTVHLSTSPIPAIGLRLAPASVSDGDRDVWILLTRHYSDLRTDGEIFMALHVLPDDGEGAALVNGDGATTTATTSFSNSTHLLATLVARLPQASYLLTTSEKLSPHIDPREGGVRFSLTVYSTWPFTLRDAGRVDLRYREEIGSEWRGKSAGGHHGLATFGNNPMWRLTLTKPQEIRAKVTAKNKDGVDTAQSVNIKVVRASGDGRAFDLEARDVVADSGKYVHGLAQLRIPRLRPGDFTIVASSYVAGPAGAGQFSLIVESDGPLVGSLSAIQAEGAGMFHRSGEGVWSENTRWNISGGNGLCSIKLRLQAIPEAEGLPSPPIRLTLHGPPGADGKRPVVASSPLVATLSGCVIPNIRLTFRPEVVFTVLPEVHGRVAGKYLLWLYAEQPLKLCPA